MARSVELADYSRCVMVTVMPIGLSNIGWKMYMINGSWDIVIFALIVSSCLCFYFVSLWIVIDKMTGHILGRDQRQNTRGD